MMCLHTELACDVTIFIFSSLRSGSWQCQNLCCPTSGPPLCCSLHVLLETMLQYDVSSRLLVVDYNKHYFLTIIIVEYFFSSSFKGGEESKSCYAIHKIYARIIITEVFKHKYQTVPMEDGSAMNQLADLQ